MGKPRHVLLPKNIIYWRASACPRWRKTQLRGGPVQANVILHYTGFGVSSGLYVSPFSFSYVSRLSRFLAVCGSSRFERSNRLFFVLLPDHVSVPSFYLHMYLEQQVFISVPNTYSREISYGVDAYV